MKRKVKCLHCGKSMAYQGFGMHYRTKHHDIVTTQQEGKDYIFIKKKEEK